MRPRAQLPAPQQSDETGGAWYPVEADGKPHKVIASWGLGWDHVSVSRMYAIDIALKNTQPPTWAAMEEIRRIFFHEKETVVQIHPPLAQYINHHPGVLHLWRKQDAEHPIPPSWMIA